MTKIRGSSGHELVLDGRYFDDWERLRMNQVAPIGSAIPRHYDQLDSLRAFAVVGVLVSHWIPHHGLPVGIWGVRLFFVLSGFLITAILLQSRDDAEVSGVNSGSILVAFYARRFLRIFPLYYAILAFAAFANSANRNNVFWFITYTQNILFAIDGVSRQMPHLWSLAVEEQFYLVWPWLILIVPRKFLGPSILAVIFLGPVSKAIALWSFGSTPYVASMLPTSCLDTLGAGGMLAYGVHEGRNRAAEVRRTVRMILAIGSMMLLGVVILDQMGIDRGTWDILDDLASSVAFVGLVGSATYGFRGPVGWLLETRPLRLIGKISYGIYVIHLFTPGQVAKVAPWIGLDRDLVATPIVWFPVTFVAAYASWRFLELPINRLKKYFPYVPSARVAKTGPRSGLNTATHK